MLFWSISHPCLKPIQTTQLDPRCLLQSGDHSGKIGDCVQCLEKHKKVCQRSVSTLQALYPGWYAFKNHSKWFKSWKSAGLWTVAHDTHVSAVLRKTAQPQNWEPIFRSDQLLSGVPVLHHLVSWRKPPKVDESQRPNAMQRCHAQAHHPAAEWLPPGLDPT